MRGFLITLFSSLLWFSAPVGAAAYACSGPKGGKVGQCAPDFELADLQGKRVRLSSYAGKVVFLNFWATWCAPCATEIPWMETASHRLIGKDFAVLTVSIDTEGGAAKIDRYFQDLFKKKAPFPVLLDTTKAISAQYGTFKVPETYIIDKTGKIRDKIEGIRDWSDSMLIHYFEVLASLK